MPSKTRTIRLGERADEQLARLAERLGLSHADLLRLALHHLEKSPDLIRELDAYAAARALIDGLIAEYGKDAQLGIEVPVNAAQADVWILPRGHAERQPALALHATVRRGDGRLTVDLHDSERGVTIHDLRSAEEDPGGVNLVMQLRAIHIHSPVPPIADETVTEGPNGKEMTVYQPDGTAVRYLLRADGPPGFAPNRRATLKEPTQ